jgi:putative membrane protein
MVSWMAGLFYLPRIFVYHAEQGTVGSAQSEIFKVMEYKLMRFIMIPSMVSTWLFGLVLCFIPGVLEITTDYWFYIKGFFVLILTWFTFWCYTKCNDFKGDKNIKTGKYYRIMNEVPTVALIIIVIMVIIKPI